jgi:uncharacterized NAD(P)/FAD-binding protein YdhS
MVGGGLRTADGDLLPVDRVVLAPGNLPPAPPAALPAEVLEHPHYIADPWCADRLAQVRAGHGCWWWAPAWPWPT